MYFGLEYKGIKLWNKEAIVPLNGSVLTENGIFCYGNRGVLILKETSKSNQHSCTWM